MSIVARPRVSNEELSACDDSFREEMSGSQSVMVVLIENEDEPEESTPSRRAASSGCHEHSSDRLYGQLLLMLMMLLSCLICLVTIYGLFCTLFLRVSKRSDYHVREQTNIIAASANDLRELYYCISVYPRALGFGRCGLLCRADTKRFDLHTRTSSRGSAPQAASPASSVAQQQSASQQSEQRQKSAAKTATVVPSASQRPDFSEDEEEFPSVNQC